MKNKNYSSPFSYEERQKATELNRKVWESLAKLTELETTLILLENGGKDNG